MISFNFLNKNKTNKALILKNAEKSELSKLNLNEIIQVNFPENQYIKEKTNKNQIVLHHTVSGQGVDGDIAWWRSTVERIGTALIIGWDGKIYQCFSSQYWAYHIGKGSNLEKHSIGIEIDGWGALIYYDKQWYPVKWDNNLKKYVPNLAIRPVKNVIIYENGFRGFFGFERYTDEQIESVRKLLQYFSEKYNIPLDYNEDMWDVSNRALNGEKGIWTHASFRIDKSDCHPQPELIQMLKSLK